MTKKTKNINKILITSRLTGTLAVSALVGTADLVPTPPEDDTGISVLGVCSEYFNILQVAEKVLDTDLDDDGEVGTGSAKPDHSGSVTRPNRRPIASNRPGLSNKPGSSNKPQPGLGNKPGSSNKPSSGKPGNKPTQNKPSSGKPGANNGKPGANAPGSGSSAKPDNKPNGNKPSVNKPSGNKPSGNKPSGNKPSGNRPSGNKPSNGGTPESIKMELLNERDVLDVAAKPMTKEAALRDIKPYKFTLKNSGTVNFDANIKLNIKENSLKVNNRDVRVYVTDNYGNVVMDGTFDQLLSKNIRISRFMDRSFNLWAWLDKPTSVKDGKFEFIMSALATQSMERGSN